MTYYHYLRSIISNNTINKYWGRAGRKKNTTTNPMALASGLGCRTSGKF